MPIYFCSTIRNGIHLLCSWTIFINDFTTYSLRNSTERERKAPEISRFFFFFLFFLSFPWTILLNIVFSLCFHINDNKIFFDVKIVDAITHLSTCLICFGNDIVIKIRTHQKNTKTVNLRLEWVTLKIAGCRNAFETNEK